MKNLGQLYYELETQNLPRWKRIWYASRLWTSLVGFGAGLLVYRIAFKTAELWKEIRGTKHAE